MPFAFISHASDDKKRIAPLLLYLQKEFDLPMWVDKPEDIDPAFEAKGKIRLGNLWTTDIHVALSNCGCVIVFWSKHTTKDREVIHDEALSGLQNGHLLQVVLDREAFANIEKHYSKAHLVEIYDQQDTPLRRAKLKELAERAKAKIWEKKPPDRIPRQLVPYVIDRDPQISHMREMLSGLAKAIVDPEAGRPLIILRGRPRDCPERLLERLEAVEEPEICRQSGKREWERWGGEIVCEWPKETHEPARVGKEIRSILKSHHGSLLERPHIVSSHIKSYRNNEGDYVAAWLHEWSQAITDNPDKFPVPILILTTPDSSFFWGLPRGYKSVMRTITSWQRKAGVLPLLLDELSPVYSEHANVWSKRCFGSNDDIRTDVTRFIRTTFPNDKFSLVLDDFAQRVETSDWFGKLKA